MTLPCHRWGMKQWCWYHVQVSQDQKTERIIFSAAPLHCECHEPFFLWVYSCCHWPPFEWKNSQMQQLLVTSMPYVKTWSKYQNPDQYLQFFFISTPLSMAVTSINLFIPIKHHLFLVPVATWRTTYLHFSFMFIGVCPEEGKQDGERSWGQDVQGAAEVTWFVQLEAEKVRGDLLAAYNFLMGRGRCWSPLSGDQQQDTSKWNEAASGEVQAGH